MTEVREPHWVRNALVRMGGRKPASWLRTRRHRAQETRALDTLATTFDKSIWFQNDRFLELHKLFDSYGSDKGSAVGASPYFPWPPHSYADVYSSLFAHCRFSMKRVFECGIGTNDTEFASNMSERGRPGASLRAWRDYFPNAQIFGADIDSSVLFSEDRIRTFYVDQTDPASIREMWKIAGNPTLDLVIDDGLHTLQAAMSLLESTWQWVREGGLYIIEDVRVSLLNTYRLRLDEFPAWITYVLMPTREGGAVGDNCLVILRKCGPC